MHDGLPFRRGLRKTHRGHARANRTKDGTLAGRKAPPAIYVRNFYAAGPLAENAFSSAGLSEIRIAGCDTRIGATEIVAKEDSSDGGAASKACAAGSGRGGYAGHGHEAASGWFVTGVRATRVFLASQCSHS